jgi:hypothetical protein
MYGSMNVKLLVIVLLKKLAVIGLRTRELLDLGIEDVEV